MAQQSKATAKRIFANQLQADDLDLSDTDFKQIHKSFRDRCKPMVLGILYGKTIYGIAGDLGRVRRVGVSGFLRVGVSEEFGLNRFRLVKGTAPAAPTGGR